MDFSSFLIFCGKVLFIDLAIELLRQAAYAIQYNAWASSLLHRAKNRYFDWFLQGFEVVSIISLLSLGYSMIFIIVVLFILTYSLKYLGNWILSR